MRMLRWHQIHTIYCSLVLVWCHHISFWFGRKLPSGSLCLRTWQPFWIWEFSYSIYNEWPQGVSKRDNYIYRFWFKSSVNKTTTITTITTTNNNKNNNNNSNNNNITLYHCQLNSFSFSLLPTTEGRIMTRFILWLDNGDLRSDCSVFFHQKQPGASSVLVLQPVLYWFQPGLLKEPLCFCKVQEPSQARVITSAWNMFVYW